MRPPSDAEMDDFAEAVDDAMCVHGLTERQAVELLTLGDIYSPSPTPASQRPEPTEKD